MSEALALAQAGIEATQAKIGSAVSEIEHLSALARAATYCLERMDDTARSQIKAGPDPDLHNPWHYGEFNTCMSILSLITSQGERGVDQMEDIERATTHLLRQIAAAGKAVCHA